LPEGSFCFSNLPPTRNTLRLPVRLLHHQLD